MDEEKSQPIFNLFKGFTKENLPKGIRIEMFYGLIAENTTDRRGKKVTVNHQIQEYLHPSMKDSPKAFILDFLMRKTFKKRHSQRVENLAHKIFLFYQLLQASEAVALSSPSRSGWKPPPPYAKFKAYIDKLEDRLLDDALKVSKQKKDKVGGATKRRKKSLLSQEAALLIF